MQTFPPNQANSLSENRQVLEMIWPDALHLFITVECLLAKYQLRVTRKLHPVLAIKWKNPGELSAICWPTAESHCISHVYVEFQELQNPDLIESLKKDLIFHMQSVQSVTRDHQAIMAQVDALRDPILQSKVKVDAPKEEWSDLLKWLQSNFYFFWICILSCDA